MSDTNQTSLREAAQQAHDAMMDWLKHEGTLPGALLPSLHALRAALASPAGEQALAPTPQPAQPTDAQALIARLRKDATHLANGHLLAEAADALEQQLAQPCPFCSVNFPKQEAQPYIQVGKYPDLDAKTAATEEMFEPAGEAPGLPVRDSWHHAIDDAGVGLGMDCTGPDTVPAEYVALVLKHAADVALLPYTHPVAPALLEVQPVAWSPDWLYDQILEVLRHHRLQYWAGEEGENYPLADALTPDVDTDIARGLEELTHIADAIYNEVLCMAPAPGAPSQPAPAVLPELTDAQIVAISEAVYDSILRGKGPAPGIAAARSLLAAVGVQKAPQEDSRSSAGEPSTVIESEELARIDWEQAFNQERLKFQAETLRTAELSAMLLKWLQREQDRGCTADPWPKACYGCDLMREAKALLEKPIAPCKWNEAPTEEEGDAYMHGWFDGNAAPKYGAPRWKHAGRGTFYTEIGRGKLQAGSAAVDMTDMVIYQGDDGLLWCRAVEEFEDGGRFLPVGAPVAQASGDQAESTW